ncbi:hypothetical protein HZB04_00455 [Candidatus Wolfebacteria bacterium]|nr:hypothetical protein [Candidatus Wolfebacteria bacterium]
MKDNLLNNLKSLKNIAPDAEYSKNSLNFILAQTKNKAENGGEFKPFGFINWAKQHRVLIYSGATGILTLALVVLTVISYLPGNKNSLVAEANDINNSIKIRLDEIKYQLDLNKQISSSTIDEVQNSLAKAIEELKAIQNLNVDDAKNLEEVLNKIKNTNDIIFQIKSQIELE